MSTPRAAFGDSVAIGLSGLCLAHCLALPVLVSLLPVAGAWAEAAWVHWSFVLVAAPVSLWTFLHPKQRAWPLIGLAGAGLASLVAGAAEFPTHELETPLSVVGGVMLAGAHLLNWRRRPRCHGDQA